MSKLSMVWNYIKYIYGKTDFKEVYGKTK